MLKLEDFRNAKFGKYCISENAKLLSILGGEKLPTNWSNSHGNSGTDTYDTRSGNPSTDFDWEDVGNKVMTHCQNCP